MLTPEIREAIVAEAKSWIKTPYHPGGRIKKVGCDCATFIAEVCIALGLIPNIDIPKESAAHFLETKNPAYLETVLQFAEEISEADVQPGDLVMYKRRDWAIFTHGGIVVSWPNAIVHASNHHGVVMESGVQGALRHWERKIFRIKV